MSKATVHANDIASFVFQNIAMPSYGGTLYASLHTASPTASGTQASSEATYTGYARVAITRDGTGWNVSGGQASNVSNIAFPVCTGGSNTITHIGIGTSSTGTGTLLRFGALSSSVAVASGVQPIISAGGLTDTES